MVNDGGTNGPDGDSMVTSDSNFDTTTAKNAGNYIKFKKGAPLLSSNYVTLNPDDTIMLRVKINSDNSGTITINEGSYFMVSSTDVSAETCLSNEFFAQYLG